MSILLKMSLICILILGLSACKTTNSYEFMDGKECKCIGMKKALRF